MTQIHMCFIRVAPASTTEATARRHASGAGFGF
jgi:hypothetical protein